MTTEEAVATVSSSSIDDWHCNVLQDVCCCTIDDCRTDALQLSSSFSHPRHFSTFDDLVNIHSSTYCWSEHWTRFRWFNSLLEVLLSLSHFFRSSLLHSVIEHQIFSRKAADISNFKRIRYEFNWKLNYTKILQQEFVNLQFNKILSSNHFDSENRTDARVNWTRPTARDVRSEVASRQDLVRLWNREIWIETFCFFFFF